MKPIGISSADPLQNVSRPVVMLSKDYESGTRTDLHAHSRIQFLFAQSGTMRARTHLGSWIVPSGYALLIPAGIEHKVEMFGQVSLRSAYIQPEMLAARCTQDCSVIHVSPLLAISIDRFASRPLEYDETDIATPLAAVIISEISNTRPSPMALPFPEPPKLRAIADELLNDPSLAKSIDHWADEVGMSRRSFTRAFRAATGMSFGQWQQRLRYQVANELLAAGHPASRVAAQVGYKSSAALKAMMERID